MALRWAISLMWSVCAVLLSAHTFWEWAPHMHNGSRLAQTQLSQRARKHLAESARSNQYFYHHPLYCFRHGAAMKIKRSVVGYCFIWLFAEQGEWNASLSLAVSRATQGAEATQTGLNLSFFSKENIEKHHKGKSQKNFWLLFLAWEFSQAEEVHECI